MITSPLLSDVHHRVKITPVSRVLATLIHISPSLLDNLSFVWSYSRNGNCPLDWTQIQCSIPGVAKAILCIWVAYRKTQVTKNRNI